MCELSVKFIINYQCSNESLNNFKSQRSKRKITEEGKKETTRGIVASVAVERRSNTRKERKVVAKTA
jgi:hypothetical protein